MKIEWEAKDIVPGQIVAKEGREERWIIGYNPNIPSSYHFALISLSDGMIAIVNTNKEGLAIHLNRTGDQPAELVDRPRSAALDRRVA